jgi:hypothetical protein
LSDEIVVSNMQTVRRFSGLVESMRYRGAGNRVEIAGTGNRS